MALLTIIYDEIEPPMRFSMPPPEVGRVLVATMPLGDGLANRDVYEVARRLAELMLEQLAAEER